MSSALTKKQSVKSSGPGASTGRSDELPWVTQHQPTTAELAVHKKKVTELREWLDFAFQPSTRRAVLLLSGPPGAGKTATVRALSHDLSYEIIEWTNQATFDKIEVSAELTLYPESQTKQFQTFLSRANRYPSLVMGGADTPSARKIVLVEEFPNVFLRDPSEFHKVLRSAVGGLVYPLVLICSDSQHSCSSSKLFNKSLLSQLDIHSISFNPIAHTSLVKTLQRIVSIECSGKSRGLGYHAPGRDEIEQLAESSAGDVRSAVNALQVLCLPGGLSGGPAPSKPDKRSVKHLRQRSGSSSKLKRVQSSEFKGSSVIGGRDCSLFLFRALGKILYCKRDLEADQTPLPGPLAGSARLPLLVNPEDVLDQCNLSSELFLLYLQQNYLQFFDSLEDAVEGCGYLSDAIMLSRLWSESKELLATLQSYCGLVGCRGLMYSNQSTAAGKWRPLHKPQWTTAHRQYIENSETARGLFIHLGTSPSCHLWTPIELQTEVLPYLAIINPPLRNTGQAGFLETITHFKQHRRAAEALGEKEAAEHTTHNTTRDQGPAVSSSQSQQAAAMESDDEISDFDDDPLW